MTLQRSVGKRLGSRTITSRHPYQKSQLSHHYRINSSDSVNAWGLSSLKQGLTKIRRRFHDGFTIHGLAAFYPQRFDIGSMRDEL